MKIGVLGGTFNPPHIGHLILAQQVLEQLCLDKVFFIPAYRPPHKNSNCLEPKFRLKLIQLAVTGNPKFQVLDIEIERKGTSYTVDTVAELKKRYQDVTFYLIIGSDLADSFDCWKNPDKIKKMAKLVVAKRRGVSLGQREDFLFVDINQIEISSSLVRKRIKEAKSIKYLVPEKVERYIRENNLYL